jgi:hypothetical protein
MSAEKNAVDDLIKHTLDNEDRTRRACILLWTFACVAISMFTLIVYPPLAVGVLCGMVTWNAWQQHTFLARKTTNSHSGRLGTRMCLSCGQHQR